MDYSFGYVVLLNSRPDLASDMNELPKELVENGSLDDIALELEVMKSGDAFALRTNALRAYALRVDSGSAYTTGHNVAADDAWLGTWVALVCARHVLERQSITGSKITEGVALVEAALRGAVDWEVVYKASQEMDLIAARYPTYTQLGRRHAAFSLRFAMAAAWRLLRGHDDLAVEHVGMSVFYATDVYDEGTENEIQLNRELSEKIVESMTGFPVRVYDRKNSR